MAIVFHSKEYSDITVDSYKLIGVMGNYQDFFKLMEKDNICYLGNEIINSKQTIYQIINGSTIKEETLDKVIKDLDLKDGFLNKKISDLSHSERKIFRYIQMMVTKANIIVIDEPFLDLDSQIKKKIISIFNQLVKTKTVIIGSFDSDTIYSLCKKVLLLGKNKYLYDNVSVLTNKSVLKRFHILMPEIVRFVRLANDKKINYGGIYKQSKKKEI